MTKIKDVLVSLKAMTSSDVTDEYLSWLSDPKINKHLEVRFNIPSKAEAIDFVRGFDHKVAYMFLICDTTANLDIGTAIIRVDPNNRTASWGYLIGNIDYWGTNAGVDAIYLLMNFTFDVLNLRKVSGGAHITNTGSIFNFYKMGFVQEGRLRAAALVNGIETDVLLFRMLKSEWIEFRKRLEASA